jgi:hypothetical protein
MFAANTYRIRMATDGDTDTLRRLAEQSSARPLAGRVLVGEIDDVVIAALSLSDGRATAGSVPYADYVVANLRARADSIRAYEAAPSVSSRLLGGLPAWYRAIAVPPATTQDERTEREPTLVRG